jgi:simple sugar transport system substrate-binding protein
MTTINRRKLTQILGGAALAAPAIMRAARADAPLKVGFVYLGPVGDFGWTYQHDVGRKAAQAALGSAVVTSYVENVPEAPECQAVFENLAASGHKLIFGTSFGYMNYMVKVAGQYPGIKFEHCTGYKNAPNLATYDIRFYQGPGSGAGNGCVPAWHAERQSKGEAEIHHDRQLVRSRQGRRRGQSADRPGLRHHHTAYR